MAKKKTQTQPESAPRAVVGIGASAGGLESMTVLLKHLPADTGLALLFVQHIDPNEKSHLVELLSRHSRLKVVEATHDETLQADTLYVVPPGKVVACEGDRLKLGPLQTGQRGKTINHLLTSLADQFGGRAVGVILSGTGNDGVDGLLAIRAAGGVTYGEDSSALFPGMPGTAAAMGSVDFVLSADAIADELVTLAHHPYLGPVADEQTEQAEEFLPRIFNLVRQQTGVDFALYKPTTVRRRITRRMLLQRVENLETYYQQLRQSPEAVDVLYQDLLITVTGLFRDPDAYEVLATRILPAILDSLEPDQPIRIWIPGCSKGDEVYSIAITVLEVLSERQLNRGVQIFATDINDKALERARSGLYPEALAEEVSAERLKRFFYKIDRGYQICKVIRDMCVFARQDLTRDPPFSRLDLISCRNVLIYLNAPLQFKILRIFHYALKPGGFLMLGASESLGRASEFFVQVERLQRIFSRRPVPAPLPMEPFEAATAARPLRLESLRPLSSPPMGPGGLGDVQREADRLTLARYAPPGVLLNDELEIVQFRGRTGLYFEHPSGNITNNVLKLAREGLLADLRSALQEGRETGLPVRRDHLKVRTNGDWTTVDLEVFRSPCPGRGTVIFWCSSLPRGQPRPCREWNCPAATARPS